MIRRPSIPCATSSTTVRLARHGLLLAVLGLASLSGLPASAQNFPSRPITMVLPTAAGALSDAVGRTLAKAMAAEANVTVVPDNRAGANGVIGVQAALNAPPDGHTLLFATSSPAVLNKFLVKNLPYDTQKDFIPIGIMFRLPLVMVVNSKLPFKTAQELIAHARQNPGKLNFGYATALPELSGKMVEQLTGTKVTFVAYKGIGGMLTALMTGEVDMTITDATTLAPLIKAGQVRPLASTGTARVPSLPDVPTMVEAGIRGYEVSAWNGLFVRAGTPPAVVARLTEMLRSAYKSADLRAFLASNNIDSFLVTGQEAVQFFNADVERWEKITRAAGVVPN